MLNIKDRILSHNTSKATLYFDENYMPVEDNPRLAEMRDKFIRSVYQLLKSQGASGLIKDFGTSKSAKIESLPSAVYSFGRHGSLSSRLRRKLRILLRHLAPVCLYG